MFLQTFLYGIISGAIIVGPLSYALGKKLSDLSHRRSGEMAKSIAMDILKETGSENENVSRLIAQNISSSTEAVLERKQAEIESIIRPLSETIDIFQKKIGEMEKERIRESTTLKESLKQIAELNQMTSEETRYLSNILRNSVNRGRWGELTLKRIVEISGLQERIDFEEQVRIDGGNRPDMIIHLPGDRDIIVDSKAPFSNYLDYTEAKDEASRKKILKDFSTDLKSHIRALGGKDYYKYVKGSANFTVLFLPEESMFSAALSGDERLMDYALSQNVVICTPMTLLALLRVVSAGWEERTIMENSRNILILARELHDRLKMIMERVEEIGKNIGILSKSYNELISGMEARLFPSLRKLEKIGNMQGLDLDLELRENVNQLNQERWN